RYAPAGPLPSFRGADRAAQASAPDAGPAEPGEPAARETTPVGGCKNRLQEPAAASRLQDPAAGAAAEGFWPSIACPSRENDANLVRTKWQKFQQTSVALVRKICQ